MVVSLCGDLLLETSEPFRQLYRFYRLHVAYERAERRSFAQRDLATGCRVGQGKAP